MDDDKRVKPKTWQEYVQEFRTSLGVMKAAWAEFTDGGTRRFALQNLIFTCILMAISSLQPFAMGYIIDGLKDKATNWIAIGFLIYAGVNLLVRLLGVLQWRHAETTWNALEKMVDARINRRFFEKSVGQHLREGHALSAETIEKGRGSIKNVISTLMYGGIGAIARFLIAFLLLSILSPVAGVVFLAAIVSHFGFTLTLSVYAIRDGDPIETQMRNYARYKSDCWHHVEHVKTTGKDIEEPQTLSLWLHRILEADFEHMKGYIHRQSLRDISLTVANLTILAYGIWNVWRGAWTLGVIYPLLSWTGSCVGELYQLTGIERQIMRAYPSMKAMYEALMIPAEAPDDPNAVPAPTRPCRIEIRDVSYRYRPEKHAKNGHEEDTGTPPPLVLRNLNLVIHPGDRVGLIGSSGTGKTTVTRLLLRHEDPESGSILVDGTDLRKIARASWMRQTAIVLQRESPFDGTIRENLTYGLSDDELLGLKDADLQRLVDALSINFGERLTKGLETIVGKRGVKLSGGQVQRLLLGAAVIRKPNFLIIDEATSNLDPVTERAVQAGLLELLPKTTGALVIAHRFSTLRALCTKFVVLSDVATLPPDAPQVEAIASSKHELHRISPTFRRLIDAENGIVHAPQVLLREEAGLA